MLRLLTFGGLSLVDDGAPVTGAASQRSRLALLAILAAAGPPGVSRDKLLASLWPESEEERARHALKQAVYALRRDLGNENAIAGTATLTLDPSVVASDIREFEDALARGDDAAAVSVYTGPFLDGVFVRGAAQFDQWAGTERTRLERAYLDALERLAKRADTQGDLAGAVQWWRKAAAAEPVSGRYALLLMRALAESGDVSAAIQHARVHEAVVRSELDASPDDAVTAFADELKRGEWKPAPRVTRGVEPAVSRGASAPATAAVAEDAAGDTEAAPIPSSVSPPRARRPSRVLVGAVSLAVLIAVAMGGAFARERMSSMFRPTDATKNRLMVVAGFANRTGDRKLDAVGDLAADYLVSRLVNSGFTIVDSRTTAAARSVFTTARLLTAYDSAAALAADLHAGTVISGKYHQQGDTLLFQAEVVDPAQRTTRFVVGPVVGATNDYRRIVRDLGNALAAKLSTLADSNPGASTAALVPPPTTEAYLHARRGWEMFFSRPADTAAAFEELKRASSQDSSYTTPKLMRAYILDVKEQWSALAAQVKELEAQRATMGRVELASLALYDADLHGDLTGRLRASRELLRLSPGSTDMSLLVAVSASYLHRPREVLDVLRHSNPQQGINSLTPMYWAWRAEAEHALGLFDAELLSATEMTRGFPDQLYGAQARARALAAKGDTATLNAHLKNLGFSASSLTDRARKVALLGARELRAHGHAVAATTLFARIAALPPAASASRDARSEHALALYESGNLTAARAAYQGLLATDQLDLGALGRLGSIAVKTGDSTAARQIDDRLANWANPYAFGEPTYWRAHFAALGGRSGEAMALINEAIAKGYRALDLNIITTHEEPDFIALWGSPAFKELLDQRDAPGTGP